jgi:hypothetical protein
MDLGSWVDEQAARVLEVGSTCALGGDATWDALMREHGVEPLSREERHKHVTEGAKRSKGALPIEVRMVITSIYDRAREVARKMEITTDSRKIDQRLYSLVDEVTRAHLQRVTPAAPTTSSIFANARATTPSYGGGVKAGLNQMKCTMCGGPRRSEELGPCVYCGGTLS